MKVYLVKTKHLGDQGAYFSKEKALEEADRLKLPNEPNSTWLLEREVNE